MGNSFLSTMQDPEREFRSSDLLGNEHHYPQSQCAGHSYLILRRTL